MTKSVSVFEAPLGDPERQEKVLEVIYSVVGGDSKGYVCLWDGDIYCYLSVRAFPFYHTESDWVNGLKQMFGLILDPEVKVNEKVVSIGMKVYALKVEPVCEALNKLSDSRLIKLDL